MTNTNLATNLTTNLTAKPTILNKDNDNANVTVIDSIMGAGKTSYAIQMMQEAEASQNFIYITPFISETERIKESVTNRDFITPKNTGKGKLNNLKKLILQEKDISSTHALFTSADTELLELLKASNYTLILDEAMNVLEQLHLNKDDLTLLIKNDMIMIEEDTGRLSWNKESDYQDTEYNTLKELSLSGNLYFFENTIVFWTFPVNIFKAFKEVYILTYLFEAQQQKYYYDFFNVNYEYKSIQKINDRYELINYDERIPYDKEKLKSLITIYDDDKINNIGEDYYSLSKSWFRKEENENLVKKLQNNVSKYFRYGAKINGENIANDEKMWTTFKDYQDKLKGNGYGGLKHKAGMPYRRKENFVSMNIRATNDLKHKKGLAYLVNRFMNPYELKFFASRNIEVNQDMFALSELLQWLWRSQLREGKEIILYIPSSRMRNLLIDYLDSDL